MARRILGKYPWEGVGSLAGQMASPAQATKPPPSLYDPTIDINEDAAGRGFGDYSSDYVRDFGEPGTALGGRAGTDYTYNRGLVTRNQGQSLADALRSNTRGGQDLDAQAANLATGEQRAGEDYQRATQTLGRNYTNLGSQQTDAARSKGIFAGGALAASANRRTTNQAFDQAPIDTGYARQQADFATAKQQLAQARTRQSEDYGTAQERINQSAGDQNYGLDTGYLRAGEDSSTALARAMRELQQYGLDSDKLRAAQARQNNWVG